MDERKKLVESLVDRAEEYGKTSVELLKLKTVDKATGILSSMAIRFTLFFFFLVAYLLLNVGVSLWIGVRMERVYVGFFPVAGFNLLMALLVFMFRSQWIKTPLSNS